MNMDFVKIRDEALKEIKESKDATSLESARVKFLGRKGRLTLILRSLGRLPLSERKKIGPQANALKKELEELFNQQIEKLKAKSSKLKAALDVTRPGERVSRGHPHPLTTIEEEIRQIFSSMNFSVVDGPEVETEYYNFDALNIPPDHPARDMWDTFWLKRETRSARGFGSASDPRILRRSYADQRLLMRTHTSPVQIRYMESHNPPFQIIAPGRVFRYEAIDAGHEINFEQLEGLMVGEDVTLANFKFVVEEFFKKFFKGQKINFRYRPSYFPFVEPGLEVDIKFKNKWLEIMGAGMVHPKVFEAVRYNPRRVRGFAFGMGPDRLAMIKYNIPDIRLFYSGDLRFIKQF